MSARAGLYREYARVIEMCEGTGVLPNACVRCRNSLWRGNSAPPFIEPVDWYTFAVAIVDGTPVFPVKLPS